jgi:hypothetical protein
MQNADNSFHVRKKDEQVDIFVSKKGIFSKTHTKNANICITSNTSKRTFCVCVLVRGKKQNILGLLKRKACRMFHNFFEVFPFFQEECKAF